MKEKTDKPMKIGTEITVRISLTLMEAPDVFMLLMLTPVRQRGKLMRLALKRYIAETGHPAGVVENQLEAISTWLRSRVDITEPAVLAASLPETIRPVDTEGVHHFNDVQSHSSARSDPALAAAADSGDIVHDEVGASSPSIRRWLEA